MSRRRYLSTAISRDSRVNQLAMQAGDFAVLLYTWLIPHAEDDGIVYGDPDEILMTVLPGRRDKSPEDVATALEAMHNLGLVCWDRQGNRVLFPPDAFYKHQSYVPQAKRRKWHPTPDTSADKHPPATNSDEQRSSPTNADEQRRPAENASSPSPSPSPSPSGSSSSSNSAADGESEPDPSAPPQGQEGAGHTKPPGWDELMDLVKQERFSWWNSPTILGWITERVEAHGVDLVREAILLTIQAGKDNWKYTEAILDSWKRKGITTVEAARAEAAKWRERRRAQRGEAGPRLPPQSSEPAAGKLRDLDRWLAEQGFLDGDTT